MKSTFEHLLVHQIESNLNLPLTASSTADEVIGCWRSCPSIRALALAGGAVACACALWLVWGRTHSLEGALRRALLTGVDDDLPH